jgi:hypothetical protein
MIHVMNIIVAASTCSTVAVRRAMTSIGRTKGRKTLPNGLTSVPMKRLVLSKYSVIVTGVRAYERRSDLRAYNRRLLDYAERGGAVIVQNNKYEFNQSQYGPYPAQVSGNRVSDENVPVKVLVPNHPAFTYPNRIGASTWANWVQERGLYSSARRIRSRSSKRASAKAAGSISVSACGVSSRPARPARTSCSRTCSACRGRRRDPRRRSPS